MWKAAQPLAHLTQRSRPRRTRAASDRDGRASVAVMIRLERAGLGHGDVVGLLLGELGQLHADLVEMQARDLLVQMLGQGVDLLLVLAGAGEKLHLRKRL